MDTGAKIMVVDDDPDMREALQMMLEAAGHTVVTASDGVECLEKLKDERPDLLLLDLLMPRMDGFAVCKELKDPRRVKYARMPIIILSSVREDASQRRYELEAGVRPLRRAEHLLRYRRRTKISAHHASASGYE